MNWLGAFSIATTQSLAGRRIALLMGSAMSASKSTVAQPIVSVPGAQNAYLAAGCFWGVEHSFRRKFGSRGVTNVQVGYIGGGKQHPTYREVCSGSTGHAEAIHVQFDPTKVAFSELLDFFYRMHDPTAANRQGPDIGTQYRSAIFYVDAEQQKIAKRQTEIAQSHFGSSRIQTTIEPADKFWPAEEYHQEYLSHNPNGYECPTHFERSWEKIESLYKNK